MSITGISDFNSSTFITRSMKPLQPVMYAIRYIKAPNYCSLLLLITIHYSPSLFSFPLSLLDTVLFKIGVRN